MHFLTLGGARVEVFANPQANCLPYDWSCSGCGYESTAYAALPFCRDDAKTHAETCTAEQSSDGPVPHTVTDAGNRAVALPSSFRPDTGWFRHCSGRGGRTTWPTSRARPGARRTTPSTRTWSTTSPHQGAGVQVSVPAFNNAFWRRALPRRASLQRPDVGRPCACGPLTSSLTTTPRSRPT